MKYFVVSGPRCGSHYCSESIAFRTQVLPLGECLNSMYKNNVFTFTKNDLLICLDRKSGEIMWAKNIYSSIKKIKHREKIGEIFNLTIANDNINLFTHEGYLLSFDFRDGSSKFFGKISKHGISSEPIFSKGNMFLTDGKNKILKFN